MASRRDFLTRAAVAGVAGAGLCGATTYAVALPKAERDRLSPSEIVDLMKQGNARFRQGVRVNRDFLEEQRDRAAGQFPAAVILSCIDSRAPAEIIMDLGIGDVFNCRVAGNVANPDVLGSLEFACQVAGAKVALVLGHTACGAVMGAIDGVEMGNLTGLLGRIRPAVDATRYRGVRSSKNPEFVDAVARNHATLTMESIRRDSAVLRDLEQKGSISIAGAVYDLHSAEVKFLSPRA